MRRRLHRRWCDDDALWREVARTSRDTWLDHQIDWLVEHENSSGETAFPLHTYGRLVCWMHDWRTTWRTRP